MSAFAEKRDYQRMPIDCSFRYSVSDDHREHQGKVINLSNRGVLFTSKQKLEEGTLLDIVLAPSHPTTAPTQARVEVARVTNKRIFYEVACKFRNSAD